MEQETPHPADPAPSIFQRLFRRRLYPGPFAWLIVLACACGLLLLWTKAEAVGIERAEVYLLTYVHVLIALVALGLWFFVFSAYSSALRLSVGIAVGVVVVLLVGIFRIEQFSGDLLPMFVFRWEAEPDQLLRSPVAETTDVDLQTTTEYDFPQFLGPQRTACVTGPPLSIDWDSKPPQQIWRIAIGAGWSSFAIVNGYAVTMEQRGKEELVTCYDVADGRLCWYHSVQTRHQTAMGGTGPRGTPTIDEGKVYALGATGVLRCLDGANGRELWIENLLARIGVTPKEDLQRIAWGRSASPLVVDDLVVVPLGGSEEVSWVSLAAFDKHSGKLVWTGGKHQAAYASPSLATIDGQRQILIVNQDYASGHEVETGKQLWQVAWPGNSTMDANVSQAVALPGDRVLLSKGYHGGAKVVELLRDGDVWKSKEIWRNDRALRTKFSNVVIRGDYAVGLSDGFLQCVDLETGSRLWKSGRYGQGQILGVEGPSAELDLLLVQAESGDVALFSTNPGDEQELCRFPALDGKTWNNPVLFGRELLVRNSIEAACYELP